MAMQNAYRRRELDDPRETVTADQIRSLGLIGQNEETMRTLEAMKNEAKKK